VSKNGFRISDFGCRLISWTGADASFLIAFLALGSALFAQVIEGTVVNSVTKVPISDATVTIEAAGKAAYHATTDGNGAFRIEGVKDGQYTAKFSKREFLAPPRDAATRPFRIAAGSDPLRLEAQLTPMGKVSGHVFDADGRPVPAYTDLLLHDLGPGLNDGIKEGAAEPGVWRTAPLWDVAGSLKIGGLLHDGRARNVAEAVEWHDGEARAARARFRDLSAQDKAMLVAFVTGL